MLQRVASRIVVRATAQSLFTPSAFTPVRHFANNPPPPRKFKQNNNNNSKAAPAAAAAAPAAAAAAAAPASSSRSVNAPHDASRPTFLRNTLADDFQSFEELTDEGRRVFRAELPSLSGTAGAMALQVYDTVLAEALVAAGHLDNASDNFKLRLWWTYQDLLTVITRDLHEISVLLDSDSDVLDMLSDPTLPAETLTATVAAIQKELKFGTQTLSVFCQFIADGKLEKIRACTSELERIINLRFNISTVDVVTATPLTKEQRFRIAKKVREHVPNGFLSFKEQVNPSVGGGMSVAVDDYLIDLTAKSAISDLTQQLKA